MNFLSIKLNKKKKKKVLEKWGSIMNFVSSCFGFENEKDSFGNI